VVISEPVLKTFNDAFLPDNLMAFYLQRVTRCALCLFADNFCRFVWTISGALVFYLLLNKYLLP